MLAMTRRIRSVTREKISRTAHRRKPEDRTAPKVSVESYRNDPFYPRIVRAVAGIIARGKVVAPVKNATLIGVGPEALQRVSMVGDDPQLDPGIGTCGKDGQSVPVGVGLPTVRMDGITVGGTHVG